MQLYLFIIINHYNMHSSMTIIPIEDFLNPSLRFVFWMSFCVILHIVHAISSEIIDYEISHRWFGASRALFGCL